MFFKVSMWACIITNVVNVIAKKKTTTDEPTPTPTESNVPYGTHSSQVLDYYLPSAGTNLNTTRAIIVIHGGAWAAGDKFDMGSQIPFLLNSFPEYVIVNMDYRLGTWKSPGYPKQLQDIRKAIDAIKSKVTSVQRFALLGASAGAHLALLYAYKYDRKRQDVAIVVDVVGPTDFTDTGYSLVPVTNFFLFQFLGPNLYLMNPTIYKETSPVTYVTKESSKTIGFYGNVDVLVPPSQATILKKKLDKARVVNEFTVYSGSHYFDWSEQDKQDMRDRVVSFLKQHF